MYSNAFYEKHKHDKYSQNGEDGVVAAILAQLKIDQGWVCEFGAWDGKHLSNTFRLVELGFRAVFIEGSDEKFAALEKTCRSFPNIVPVLGMVSHDPNSLLSLDNILKRTEIPHDFTLLSIDIDSYDYQVWQSFLNYKPRIVIIEINSSCDPKRADYVHSEQKNMNGTGFLPTLQLGLLKGYSLLCHTGNMIFIRNEDAAQFDIPADPQTCFRQDWRKYWK